MPVTIGIVLVFEKNTGAVAATAATTAAAAAAAVAAAAAALSLLLMLTGLLPLLSLLSDSVTAVYCVVYVCVSHVDILSSSGDPPRVHISVDIRIVLVFEKSACAAAAAAAAACRHRRRICCCCYSCLALLLVLLRCCRCCPSPMRFCISCGRDGRTERRELFRKMFTCMRHRTSVNIMIYLVFGARKRCRCCCSCCCCCYCGCCYCCCCYCGCCYCCFVATADAAALLSLWSLLCDFVMLRTALCVFLCVLAINM